MHGLFTYVASIQRLNYRGHESKIFNVPFIFLTHLWPWNNMKAIKSTTTMEPPSKVIIEQNLKDLAVTVSKKWPMLKSFFFNRGYLSIISIFNECSRQKGDIEMTLTYLTILWNFNKIGLQHIISVKTVWHSYGLEICKGQWKWCEQIKLIE